MHSTLWDDFKALFTDGVIEIFNGHFSESGPKLRKAIDAVYYVSLSTIVKRMNKGEAEKILAIASGHSESILLNDMGTSLVITIDSFFVKHSPIIERWFPKSGMTAVGTVSKYANVRKTTALNLIGYCFPVLLSLIGKRIKKDDLNAKELNDWILSSAVSDGDMLPEDLNKVALGMRFGNVRRTLLQLDGGLRKRLSMLPFWKSTVGSWLTVAGLFLILLIALVFSRIYHFTYADVGKKTWGKLFGKHSTSVTIDSLVGQKFADSVGNPAASNSEMIVLGEKVTVRLPDGQSIETCDTCTCKKIIDFLARDIPNMSPQMRIFLDSVKFMPGEWKLSPKGVGQLTTIATIVKAFPSCVLTIGGHTDSAGPLKYNEQLSKSRAREAYSFLLNLHVSKLQLLGFKGFGEKFADRTFAGTSRISPDERTISLEIKKHR